jgi:coiled-coil and C2 domain-containing protein 2A
VQEEFDFVTDDDIENSRRFKFIMYRDQEIPYFKNQKIPLLDKEVPEELFGVTIVGLMCS